jgi:hypothetical protein
MARVIIAALVGSSAVLGSAFAGPEPPTVEWAKTYGGSGNDRGLAVRSTSDGGYILAGATMSFGAGYFDAYLIKVDASGTEEWSKTYGGPDNDEATSIVVLPGGDYLVGGTSAPSGSHDMFLFRTDAAGDERWAPAFGGGGYDHGATVREARDGGYLLAGFTESFGPPGRNMYAVRTDAAGNEAWSAAFGTEQEDEARAVRETADGGWILAGYTRSPYSLIPMLFLVATDDRGRQVWSKTYESHGAALSIRDLPGGGWALTGTIDWGMGAFCLTLDAEGSELHSWTFPGLSQVRGVEDLGEAGALILGSVYDSGIDESVPFLGRFDRKRNLLWSLAVSGCWMERTADGGLIVANGYEDVSLVKLGPERIDFLRGLVTEDGAVDLSDAIRILGFLFGVGEASAGESVRDCFDAADANDDGEVDISDPISILMALFLGYGPLPEPSSACGPDGTSDGLGCSRNVGCR